MLRSDDHSRVSTVHTSFATPPARTSAFHFGCVSQTISELGKDWRRPFTAGNAWTMSPKELKRTTRNFASAMRRLAHSLQQLARRMVFRVAHNRYANAQAVGHRTLRDGFRGVVGALRVDLGPQLHEQLFHIGLIENHHVIHRS